VTSIHQTIYRSIKISSSLIAHLAGERRHPGRGREYDLELRRYNGRGWRAMFFLSGLSTRSLRMPAARGRGAHGRLCQKPSTLTIWFDEAGFVKRHEFDRGETRCGPW
jgi:hypothetical protein